MLTKAKIFLSQLLKICKISENDYEETTLLPVSFAPLIQPRKEDKMKQIHIGMKNQIIVKYY